MSSRFYSHKRSLNNNQADVVLLVLEEGTRVYENEGDISRT